MGGLRCVPVDGAGFHRLARSGLRLPPIRPWLQMKVGHIWVIGGQNWPHLTLPYWSWCGFGPFPARSGDTTVPSLHRGFPIGQTWSIDIQNDSINWPWFSVALVEPVQLAAEQPGHPPIHAQACEGTSCDSEFPLPLSAVREPSPHSLQDWLQAKRRPKSLGRAEADEGDQGDW